jgi:uracil-DNA glycosylase family 4
MTVRLDARQRAMLAEMGVRWHEPLVLTDADRPELSPVQVPAPEVAPPARVSTEAATKTVGAMAPAASPRDRMSWDELRRAVAGCQACQLCTGRRNTVFGVGDMKAEWLVVGEAPGENEDLQGEPFVGSAGKLLDNMLKALGLDRQHKVYIANVLKCRPPANRNPLPQEVAQCEPFLRRQIQLLQPRIILAMGRFAVQSLLGSNDPIGKLRGRVHRHGEIPVVVTYHPAYLLRNPADKARAWDDLCLALDALGRHWGGS